MMMCCRSNTHSRYVSSREYAKLKKDFSALQSAASAGERNNQFGKMWISNPDLLSSITIKVGDKIPTGWFAGRNLTWKKCSVCGTDHLMKGMRCRSCLDAGTTPLVTARRGRKRKAKTLIVSLCSCCGNEFTAISKNKKCCSDKCAHTVSSTAGVKVLKRKVCDDQGTIFDSLTAASIYYSITVEAIRYRIKTNKYKYVED